VFDIDLVGSIKQHYVKKKDQLYAIVRDINKLIFAVCVAPFLLLRSEQSVSLAVRWLTNYRSWFRTIPKVSTLSEVTPPLISAFLIRAASIVTTAFRPQS